MKDKKNRNYHISLENEMITLRYRGTKGTYPKEQFMSIPIEEVLDRADKEIMRIFNNQRARLAEKIEK